MAPETFAGQLRRKGLYPTQHLRSLELHSLLVKGQDHKLHVVGTLENLLRARVPGDSAAERLVAKVT